MFHYGTFFCSQLKLFESLLEVRLLWNFQDMPDKITKQNNDTLIIVRLQHGAPCGTWLTRHQGTVSASFSTEEWTTSFAARNSSPTVWTYSGTCECWNLENSECFLQHAGMNYFLCCKEQFPNSVDLLRYVWLGDWWATRKQHGGMNYFLRCKKQFPNSVDLLRYVWLVTDETSGNSECFLQHGEMNYRYFLRCKEQCPISVDLRRYVWLVTDETSGNSECFLQHRGIGYCSAARKRSLSVQDFLHCKEQFLNSVDPLR